LPASFYGQTKIECEKLLSRFAKQNRQSSAIAFRFFNVGGAIESTLREENGENVFPAILGSVRQEKPFQIYGLDYPTPDGSAIRDYIHIKDLIAAIVLSLESQTIGSLLGFKTINLGTSKGTSVLELVKVFESIFNVKIDAKTTGRRAGDVPYLLADPDFAYECLGWKPVHDFMDLARSYLD
jgi:UDP-glucose 4-epimerase